MTFTLNGIGTTLSGDRWLTAEEYYYLGKHKDFQKIVRSLTKDPELKVENEDDLFRFRIATKSFAILFVPIIPLETFIYYCPKVKWHEDTRYIPLLYTKGKGKIDWNHVRSSWSFYIAPVLIVGTLLFNLFS